MSDNSTQRRRVVLVVGSGLVIVLLGVTGYFGWRALFAESVDDVPDAELAQSAHQLLAQNCHRCHGVQFRGGTLNVLDRTILTTHDAKRGSGKYLTPGDPKASEVWKRVEFDNMPQGGVLLTEQQKRLLRRWIEHGAPFPEASVENTPKPDKVGQ